MWWGIHFNPRPPRGGRLRIGGRLTAKQFISTHALLAEGDNYVPTGISIVYISTHALLAEGDDSQRNFQFFADNFNPRPPRGGRRYGCAFDCFYSPISTHALLAEGDQLYRQ